MCLKILALFLIVIITNEQVNGAVFRIRRQTTDESKDKNEEKNLEDPKNVKEKAGDAKEKAGDVKEKVGDDLEKAGDDKEKAGNDKEKAGNDKEKVGDDKEKAGDDKEKAGDAKEKAGDAKEKAGDDKEKAGDAKEKAGDAKEKAGDDKEKAGDAKEKAGDAKEKAGDVKEKVGDDLEKVGDDKEKAGDDKEKAGNDKEKVGNDKEKAADVKVKAGEDKEKVGDGKEKVSEDKGKVDDDAVKSSDATVKSSKEALGNTEKVDTKPFEVKNEEANKDTKSVQEKSSEVSKDTKEKSGDVTKADKNSEGIAENSAEVTDNKKNKKFAMRTLYTKGRKLKEDENKKNSDRRWQDKPKKEHSGLKNIVVIPERDTSVINLTVYNKAPDEEFLNSIRKENSGSLNNKDIPDDSENYFKKPILAPSARSHDRTPDVEPDALNINSDTPCYLNSYNQIECGPNSESRDLSINKPTDSDDTSNISLKTLFDNAAYWDTNNGARPNYRAAGNGDGIGQYNNFASDGIGQYSDYTSDGPSPNYDYAKDYGFVPYSNPVNINGLDPYKNYDNLDDIQRAKLFLWYL